MNRKGCHIFGVTLGAKAGVVTEFLRQFVADARAAHHQDDPVAQAFGLQQVGQPGQVVQVNVLLRHHLRHQNDIGLFFNRTGHQHFGVHLRAQVDGTNFVVTLQSFVAVEAFHVHDGVNADGVGVGLDRGADHHHAPTHFFGDQRVDSLLVHDLVLRLDDREAGQIHLVPALPVDHVEAEALAHVFAVNHGGLIEPHQGRQPLGAFFARFTERHRQSEGQLDAPITERVAVGFDPVRRCLGIKHDLLLGLPASVQEMGCSNCQLLQSRRPALCHP